MSDAPAGTRAVEAAEIAAWRDFFACAPGHVREAYGLESLEIAGALALSAARVDSLWFNRVIGLGVFEPATRATLDAISAHYDRARTNFAINLAPAAEPASLAGELEQRGFATFFHHVKWSRDASPAPALATPLTVERVTPASAEAFSRIDSEVFAEASDIRRDWTKACIARQGWTHFIASEADEPIATAALFIHEQVAWLGWAATPPHHRGKGAQLALFNARIEHARAAGCRTLTTETGPNIPEIDTTSWRNAARAGFTIAYERPSWIRP